MGIIVDKSPVEGAILVYPLLSLDFILSPS